MQDDLTLPDGTIRQVNLNNFETIHREFGLNCKLTLHFTILHYTI